MSVTADAKERLFSQISFGGSHKEPWGMWESPSRRQSRVRRNGLPAILIQSAVMDPYKFIFENIDSVPQLEALILLWNSRPVAWSAEDLSSRLYLPTEQVTLLMRDLVRLEIARQTSESPQKYSYFQHSVEQDELMLQIDTVYRRELVRISTMIHSKASSPVREFARAFRFRKEPTA